MQQGVAQGVQNGVVPTEGLECIPGQLGPVPGGEHAGLDGPLARRSRRSTPG